ncbi:hemicentin-1-like isoform X2 [Xenia sp. Carnegie-2017]|uniref:hemicentin-1-like isoform X2 n=1 Tax=Xenia sp. Carnegie-2017 TaxID=2897299 RepID=UPI001F0376D0|nr:hemicentin-1-like isoform X2 [Xenia sp. Carnegie-2017]
MLLETKISDRLQYSPSPLTVEVFKSGTLWLKNVNQSYNGEFTLAISTVLPTLRSRVNVYIAVKPNVVHNCSNLLVVNEGDNVSCVCRGEGGNPPANVTWFDKNNNIFGDDVGVVSKTLVITNVTMNDGGNYRCKAQSYNDPRFRDDKSIEIQVKAAYPPQQTNITISPMSVKKDHEVTITCESDGYPEPTYTIYHNGTGNMRVVSNDRTYIIQSVNFNSAGSYRCEAKNKRGSDLSDVKNLTVSRDQQSSSSSLPTMSSSMTILPSASSAPTNNVRKDGDGVSNIGLIIGIVVGMLFLLAILVVIFCCYKSKQKNGYHGENGVEPLAGANNAQPNHHYEEVGELRENPNKSVDNRSKPPTSKAAPHVYASIDRENREGNPVCCGSLSFIIYK